MRDHLYLHQFASSTTSKQLNSNKHKARKKTLPACRQRLLGFETKQEDVTLLFSPSQPLIDMDFFSQLIQWHALINCHVIKSYGMCKFSPCWSVIPFGRALQGLYQEWLRGRSREAGEDFCQGIFSCRGQLGNFLIISFHFHPLSSQFSA